jgi:hypothetical protein
MSEGASQVEIAISLFCKVVDKSTVNRGDSSVANEFRKFVITFAIQLH